MKLEKIKNNPGTSISSVLLIIGLITGIWAIDDRYVHAADFAISQQAITEQIDQLYSMIRNEVLEDKLFELDYISAERELTAFESAKRARIIRQLVDLLDK